jgi:glycosyltransferase involved in cell wall biosynthesis
VAVAAAVPDRWSPPGLQNERPTSFDEDGGVRTVPIPVRGAAGPGADAGWNGRALKRLLTEFRPDIVQIEEEPWTRAAATTAALARRLKLPYFVLARESLPPSVGPLGRFRRSRVLGGAKGLLAVNEQAARLAKRDRPNLEHRVVPQLGVALPLATVPEEHAGLRIGFLGRLIPEKGVDLLFRAAVKLIGRWTITVVGTGPAQEELEGLAERLGIAGRVTWLGAQPRARVDEIWPRLDCVVLPSRTAPRWVEGTPRAAQEAMAHGVAVVASSAGALPEIVGPAGAVVQEEDVGALAEALQRFHDDPVERRRIGAEGRKRVMDEYTDAAIAGKTLRFWQDAVHATV